MALANMTLASVLDVSVIVQSDLFRNPTDNGPSRVNSYCFYYFIDPLVAGKMVHDSV